MGSEYRAGEGEIYDNDDSNIIEQNLEDLP